MKKKVLFIMPSMFIGGAERSLLGLLDSFDYEKYDVDLFLYRHEGEFLKYIPENVNVLPPISEYSTFDVPIKSLLRSRLWAFGLARLFGKIMKKKHNKNGDFGVWASMQYISHYLLPLLPKIPGFYDLGISFLGVPDILVNKVSAKIKIAWNHTDYTILGPDKKLDQKLYDQVNYIASVSDACTKQFLTVYPQYKNKAITIHNVISKTLLKEQSFEPVNDMPSEHEAVRLLSIGRFSDAKNFDNIPDICRRITESGINVKWFIIGYGSDEALIRKKIEENQMQDHVIILGKKENPYPYIRLCDIYVQPSRYEGKCVSVLEAQILNKPTVITAYATAKDQLKDGVDGIVIPMDNEGAAKELALFIHDTKKQKTLTEATSRTDYTNVTELQKIYSLINHTTDEI